MRLLLLAALLLAPLAAPAQGLEGDWNGTLHTITRGDLRLMFHFARTGGLLTTDITSVDQSAPALRAATTALAGDQLNIGLPALSASFAGTLSADGKTIDGHWTQRGAALPLTLVPGAITPRKLVRAPQQGDLTLETPTGTLAGTIWKAQGSTIAALILSGSGPANRNGDSAVNGGRGLYRSIAEGLKDRGITALSIDKRGIGESAAAAPAETALRVQMYGDDARLWAAELKRRTGARCVWLIGHSEGGLVAGLAARDNRDICGIVTLAGVGRPMGTLLREQLGARLDEPLKTQAFAAIASLEAGKPVDAPPPQLLTLLRPSVQPYMMSEINLDPAALMRELKMPVLILQGDADQNVSLADARALAAARPDATLKILPGVNHTQRIASEDNGVGPGPLAPGLMDTIADFLKAHST